MGVEINRSNCRSICDKRDIKAVFYGTQVNDATFSFINKLNSSGEVVSFGRKRRR